MSGRRWKQLRYFLMFLGVNTIAVALVRFYPPLLIKALFAGNKWG